MDLKKKIRGFFTLNRRGDGGFTLVELIVVIAILAILAGVAIPVYSGYIKKANMSADQTLASDVAHALTLYYYNNPGTEGGHVVLKANGAEADSVGAAAMAAAFGDDWQNTVVLKHDGWSNDGLLSLVSGYTKEDAELINNSTFLTKSNAGDMLDATNSLLNLAADKIMKTTNADKYLKDLGGSLGETISDLGLTAGTPEYGTAVSNLLVSHFADAMSSGATLEGDTNNVSKLVTLYAQIYAYCKDKNDPTLINEFDKALKDENTTYSIIAGDGNRDFFLDKLEDSEDEKVSSQYLDFAKKYMKNSAKDDANALNKMMGAVSLIAGGYTDKESLTNENLYASDGAILDQVNTYINAVGAVASGASIPNLQAGEVAVILYADGSVSSTIGLAG